MAGPPPSPRDLRRFLYALAIVLGLAIAPLLSLGLRLAALGELPPGAPMGAGVRVRGTLFDDYATYKLSETVTRRPQLVVLGSSRVMQFRSALFTGCGGREGCFYNAGGALPSIQSGIAFLQGLPRGAAPSVLLLGVDLWQFDPAYDPTKHDPVELDPPAARSLDADLALIRRFAVLTARDPEIRAVIAGALSADGAAGVVAISRGSGFRPDGSYYYGPLVTADTIRQTAAERVAEVASRVPAGCCRFERFARADPASIAELDDLLTLAESLGTRVIAFTPPFADAVTDALEADPTDREGVADVRQALDATFRSHDVPFHWSLSMSSVGCPADEAWDGSHASEVCDARLLAILLEDPQVAAALAPYADRDGVLRVLGAQRSALFLGDQR